MVPSDPEVMGSVADHWIFRKIYVRYNARTYTQTVKENIAKKPTMSKCRDVSKMCQVQFMTIKFLDQIGIYDFISALSFHFLANIFFLLYQ